MDDELAAKIHEIDKMAGTQIDGKLQAMLVRRSKVTWYRSREVSKCYDLISKLCMSVA